MKKLTLKRKKHHAEAPARITNETVAAHREQVLAGGRKFKYPVQYQKHKLVINSIVIGVVSLGLLIAIGWQQLYVAQNTTKIMYRITQLVPVAVASVDGEAVRYSDYLMRYRSSMYYLQQNNNVNSTSADGKRESDFTKRKELDSAELAAYVQKLARQYSKEVTNKEVDDFIRKDIDNRSVSLNAYEKTVLRGYYDWSLDEYKSVLRSELLKQKVSFALDDPARDKVTRLRASVQSGADMTGVAKAESDDTLTKLSGGDTGLVPLKSDDPNGLISLAKSLEPGQVSHIVKGVDGYYFIKLTSKDTSFVRYQLIKVSLTLLDTKFKQLRTQGKIKEYITLSTNSVPTVAQ